MKVESIKIKNFKAIASEDLKINGNNVYVLGKNGVGKSSFIDAIFKIISGKDLPSKLTKNEAMNGFVEIDLGKFKVKATFNEKNEKVSLSIESKDGALYKSPRTMLDESAGIIDFDLNSFFSLSPKKQVDFIKQLIGIDFTDLDEDYKKYFDERTFTNRKVKELEAQQFFFDKNKIKPVDITEMQKKIQSANDSNNKIKEVTDRIAEREKRESEIIAEIKKLNKQVSEIKDKNKQALEWLASNEEEDIKVIQTEFNQAIEDNKEIEKNIKGLKLSNKLADIMKIQEDLNINLQSIDETKRRIITEATMPVEGLSFDDNQLYYNELPFEKSQINTAQQIIVGLQINLHLLKEIKIARFDGSLLDNENMALVEAWAKENGLQLFVEFVERNTEGLVIEIKEDSK